MNKIRLSVVFIALISFSIVLWVVLPLGRGPDAAASGPGSAERGAYLVQAAGCISCHLAEDSAPALAGGIELHSPFGTFVVPNITPDPDTGIGGWTAEQLVDAMRLGRDPAGGTYFPAFPYRSYRGMSESDARDIAAWLLAQPPVSHAPGEHRLTFPTWLGRLVMPGWNRLANLLEPELAVPADPIIARGAYLARNLGHCGECHTPRNRLGMPDLAQEFAGAPVVDGEASAITSRDLEGWSEEDFAFFLFLGLKPDEEYVGGEMEPVIEYNTSHLSAEDRLALAAFFLRGQDQAERN